MALSPTSSRSSGGGATNVYVQDADPGAVGEGKLWLKTDVNPTEFYVRNAANNAWGLVLADAFGSFTGSASGPLMRGVDGGADTAGKPAFMYAGDGNDGDGAGARVAVYGGTAGGADGRILLLSNNDSGSAGQAMVSDGSALSIWGGVKTGSGAPSGAPTGFLPLYLDGANLYVWNGAAWQGPYVP
jgi:hypothetical protein